MLALILVVAMPEGRALDESHPLAPPDTSSPRATLTNFVALIREGYAFTMAKGRGYGTIRQRRLLSDRLLYCLDLRSLPPSHRMSAGREAALLLKETLDRLVLPPWPEIPGQAEIAGESGVLAHWTIPRTEIVLARIADGPREGQYVFSAETVQRAGEFYQRVKHLPYQPGATEGLYERYVSEPGWMIPRAVVQSLPAWMRARYGSQAVWQWCVLLATLLAVALGMVGAYRLGGRWAKEEAGALYYLALLFPVLAMAMPAVATHFLANQAFIAGRVFVITEFGLSLLCLGALVVVVLGLTNRLATAVGALPWFQPQGMDAQLLRLLVRACGVAAAVAVLLEGGRYLGVSPTTLVAGASVSGLAVALAAQESLKNLFGSLMILLDKPFQVGDQIRAKGYEGTVEWIGLRSTRLRLPSGHLVSIANEEMARLDIENISRRPYLTRSDTIRLPHDTSPEKIRRAVDIAREILDQHEGLDPKLPPRVRVSSLGPDAVVLSVTYWYHPPNPVAFAAFNEKFSLRLLEQFQAEGIRLA